MPRDRIIHIGNSKDTLETDPPQDVLGIDDMDGDMPDPCTDQTVPEALVEITALGAPSSTNVHSGLPAPQPLPPEIAAELNYALSTGQLRKAKHSLPGNHPDDEKLLAIINEIKEALSA